MNVIAVYAQAKDNLSRNDALKICELYMGGLAYKDAVNMVVKDYGDKGEKSYYGGEKDVFKKSNRFW